MSVRVTPMEIILTRGMVRLTLTPADIVGGQEYFDSMQMILLLNTGIGVFLNGYDIYLLAMHVDESRIRCSIAQYAMLP